MRSGEHPTMKPVELFRYLMEISSKKGDVVFDSFGGSGTTLIAAEETGRVAYVTTPRPILRIGRGFSEGSPSNREFFNPV